MHFLWKWSVIKEFQEIAPHLKTMFILLIGINYNKNEKITLASVLKAVY